MQHTRVIKVKMLEIYWDVLTFDTGVVKMTVTPASLEPIPEIPQAIFDAEYKNYKVCKAYK